MILGRIHDDGQPPNDVGDAIERCRIDEKLLSLPGDISESNPQISALIPRKSTLDFNMCIASTDDVTVG
jgi:hypothetical protein